MLFSQMKKRDATPAMGPAMSVERVDDAGLLGAGAPGACSAGSTVLHPCASVLAIRFLAATLRVPDAKPGASPCRGACVPVGKVSRQQQQEHSC